MALPPQRITIKRRREDEPVDTLFIEQKRQRSNYLWCRVHDDGSTRESSIPATQPQRRDASCVPIVRTTSPSEDTSCDDDSSHRSAASINTQSIYPKKVKSPVKSHGRVSKNALDLTRQIAQHRKFYLSRSSSLSLGSNASKNGIKKSRKPRADLAVFVEKAANNLTPRAATTALLGPDNASKCMVDYLQIDEERKQSNPRKLPRASAAEKLWRNKSWIKKTNGISSDGKSEVLSKHPKENPNAWDCESVALAEQLHRIALLETQNVPANAKDDASTARRPKVYPKPPKARPENQSHIDQTDHQDDAPDDRTMLKSTSSGSESNYIYDTYLRVSEVDLITPPMHGIQDAENGKVGILIIEEQDEVTWQTFGEGEDESDKDWNSEEEDENAEDFYGNDYPEDEVSSSDEFDKGAYHYRVHQSDDEEYDTNDGDLRYYDINVPCPLEKRFRSTRISRFDDEDGPESD